MEMNSTGSVSPCDRSDKVHPNRCWKRRGRGGRKKQGRVAFLGVKLQDQDNQLSSTRLEVWSPLHKTHRFFTHPVPMWRLPLFAWSSNGHLETLHEVSQTALVHRGPPFGVDPPYALFILFKESVKASPVSRSPQIPAPMLIVRSVSQEMHY